MMIIRGWRGVEMPPEIKSAEPAWCFFMYIYYGSSAAPPRSTDNPRILNQKILDSEAATRVP